MFISPELDQIVIQLKSISAEKNICAGLAFRIFQCVDQNEQRVADLLEPIAASETGQQSRD